MRILQICLSLFSLVFSREIKKESFIKINQDIPDYEYKTAPNPSFQFYAEPKVIEDGEDVNIFWENVKNTDKKDFIGMWCGKQSKSKDFLDHVRIDNSTDSGVTIFPGLTNMRCDYNFGYYSVVDKTPTLLSVTKVFNNAGNSIPMYPRLAVTGKRGEMRIMWTSLFSDSPQVKYKKNNREILVNGTTYGTYTADMMCGPPANITSQTTFRDPGFQQEVLLQNLSPGKYLYSFGNDIYGWSNEYNFIIPEEKQEKYHIIAYGDLGIDGGDAAQGTIDRITSEYNRPDFLLHFGDISYARGIGWKWEKFSRMITPVSAYVPYMASIGNHEYDHTTGGNKDPSHAKGTGFHPVWGNYGDDSSGECGVPMRYRFHMPDNGNNIFWYSFDYGLTHIIQMSTEHDYMRGSDQHEWIVKDLESVDRKKTPYIIVTGHRPMYTSEQPYESDFLVAQFIQSALEDVFFKYKVDLGLYGHYHAYERDGPVFHNKNNDKGTVHITVGTAGAGLETGTFGGEGEEWYKANALNWGYLRIIVDKDKISTQFIRNSDGMVADEAEIPNKFK